MMLTCGDRLRLAPPYGSTPLPTGNWAWTRGAKLKRLPTRDVGSHAGPNANAEGFIAFLPLGATVGRVRRDPDAGCAAGSMREVGR